MHADAHVTPPLTGLSPIEGKPIIARFDGGALLPDGGLLALREVEDRLGIARRLAGCIDGAVDPRRQYGLELKLWLAFKLRVHRQQPVTCPPRSASPVM